MAKFKRSKYLLKILGKIFLLIFFSLLQISFFSLFPWPFNYFNLLLPVIFFITIILSYEQGLWFAFFSGLILDLFSFSNFGTLTLAMFCVAIIINILFNNFFTNRSFYSLIILGFLGNFIYVTILSILNFIFFIFDIPNNLVQFFTMSNLCGLFWQMFFTVLSLAVLFFIFNFFSRKLKSVFY